jgi:hypothetical protein
MLDQGGTPKSATNADIPQRPRSQRQARISGAKRTCVHPAVEHHKQCDSSVAGLQPACEAAVFSASLSTNWHITVFANAYAVAPVT